MNWKLSRHRSIPFPVLLLAVAVLACRTPAEDQQLATEIANLRSTRGALSTEVARLETDTTSVRSVATTNSATAPRQPSPTQGSTETPAPTPAPPTPTPVLPHFSMVVLGCATGLDIAHGLGEVTNAYVEVRNEGLADATNVCMRIDATDRGQAHPGERRCVLHLPANTLVRVKLTADTEFRADTAIAVSLTSDEGPTAEVRSADCAELDLPLRGEMEGSLDLVEPLPSE